MADPPQVSFDTSWSTWLAVIVGLLAFLYWKGVQRYNSLLGSSPLQGPRPLPWVGNLLDAFKYGGIHKMLLNYFYKYGRVYKMCIGRSPVIVVSDPEILKQILVKEFWKFPNRPPFAKPNPPMDAGLFVARDERWKRIRKTLTPTFTATKLKQIVPIIESSSEKLTLKLQKFAETGERVDVVNEFSLFALDVVMRAAFGMDSDIQMNPDPVFVEKAKEVFKTPLWIRFFSMFPFWDYLSRYVSVLQNMDYFVVVAKDLLNQRKEHGFKGSKDLVQLMLKAHEEHTDGVSKLSDSEITAQSVTFLVAGFETTGSTLTSTAYFLATHPEVQDRLIREIDELMETSGDEPLYEMVQKAGYMDQVFSEVLRICSPGYTLFRECAEDTIYKGIRFPKGCDVNIPIYALHRDPELWENPWEFNPDNFSPEAKERRDQFAFLPFGVGPRQCIGIRLAILEIKIGLLKILQGFKFERAPETVKKLEHHAVLLMAPKETIYVKIKAR